MDALLLLSLALLALAARTCQVRHRLAAWEIVWRARSGPFVIELRRHAHLCRLGRDSLEFPQPREFRVISLRAGGIPLWSRQAIVGLPAEADARIGAVSAGEFDHLFDHRFRRAGTPRPLRFSARAH